MKHHAEERGRARVFANPLLEATTTIHPALVAAVWLPVGLYFAASGVIGLAPATAALIVAMTVIGWTLFEYLMHRFVFHFDRYLARARRLAFIIHGVHHDEPDDRLRNTLPLGASIPIAVLVYLAFQAALAPASANLAFGMFVLCYLTYDMLHWWVHQRKPTTALGRFLRRHHLRHHFLETPANFGVTSPLWDFVFGTYAAPHGSDRGSRTPISRTAA